MAPLRNVRWELFAQGVASGRPQSRAYIEAGYAARGNSAEAHATRLVRNGQVAVRLAELQAGQRRRLNITVDNIVLELQEAMDLARETRNASAYVTAVMSLAKVLGLDGSRRGADAQLIPKPAWRPGQDVLMSEEEWQRTFAPPDLVAGLPEPTTAA